MMNFRRKLNTGRNPCVAALVCYTLFAGAICNAALPDTTAEKRVYRFGVVPQFTSQVTREIWIPILSEIEKITGLHIEFASSATIPAFETQVMIGEFDFAYMNAFIAYKAGQRKLYTPLVRDIKKSLHGIIVVNKNSNITDLKQLDNKLVGFPAPNALGASLVIKAAMTDKFDIHLLPKYVQTHSSVYLNVALGRLIAGGGVQKTFNQQDQQIKDRLKIIFRSEKLPSHPVAAHKRVPTLQQSQVRDALLKIGNTKPGIKLLQAVPIKKIGLAHFSEYEILESWNLDRFYVDR